MSAVRVGVIGAGRFGQRHAQNMSRIGGARVVGIVDVVEDRARSVARLVDCEHWHTDYQELLARHDVDAVVVALPHAHLAEAAIASARASKHVLCQKPMALSTRDALDVVRACEEAGVVLMVYGQNRYKTIYRRAREILDTGEIGSPYLVEDTRKFRGFADASYPGWFKSRQLAGGGVLQNFTCHSFDVLRWVLQQEIVSVAAMLGRFVFADVEGEDNAALLLRFSDGTLCSCVQSWTSSNNRLEVTGERGRMKVVGETLLLDRGGGYESVVTTPDGEDERFLLEAHFVRCLTEGAPPSPGGREYLGVIRAIEAAYLAAEQRREVQTGEVAELERTEGTIA